MVDTLTHHTFTQTKCKPDFEGQYKAGWEAVGQKAKPKVGRNQKGNGPLFGYCAFIWGPLWSNLKIMANMLYFWWNSREGWKIEISICWHVDSPNVHSMMLILYQTQELWEKSQGMLSWIVLGPLHGKLGADMGTRRPRCPCEDLLGSLAKQSRAKSGEALRNENASQDLPHRRFEFV